MLFTPYPRVFGIHATASVCHGDAMKKKLRPAGF
jgi:hypothetical protein